MSADPGHVTFIHNNDLICIQDRIDPLCDDNDSAVAHLFFQSLSQRLIRLEIQCGKTVVENKYLRIFCNGSGNCKSLLLSTGNIASALSNPSIKIIIFCLDKLSFL